MNITTLAVFAKLSVDDQNAARKLRQIVVSVDLEAWMKDAGK